jgi:hypothetical protein
MRTVTGTVYPIGRFTWERLFDLVDLGPATLRLVATWLPQHGNKDGGRIRPSIGRLVAAQHGCVSERTASRHLAVLRDHGLIVCTRPAASSGKPGEPGRAAEYELTATAAHLRQLAAAGYQLEIKPPGHRDGRVHVHAAKDHQPVTTETGAITRRLAPVLGAESAAKMAGLSAESAAKTSRETRQTDPRDPPLRWRPIMSNHHVSNTTPQNCGSAQRSNTTNSQPPRVNLTADPHDHEAITDELADQLGATLGEETEIRERVANGDHPQAIANAIHAHRQPLAG